MNEISMTAVYPNIVEILTPEISIILGPDLLLDIEERYKTLGPKYVGPNLHTDGRRINTCMEKDSAQDALEEIVDAAFNVCILIIKAGSNRSIAESLLKELNEMYETLASLRGEY